MVSAQVGRNVPTLLDRSLKTTGFTRLIKGPSLAVTMRPGR